MARHFFKCKWVPPSPRAFQREDPFLYFFNLKTGTITRGRLAGLKTQPPRNPTHPTAPFHSPTLGFSYHHLASQNDFLYTKLRPTKNAFFPRLIAKLTLISPPETRRVSSVDTIDRRVARNLFPCFAKVRNNVRGIDDGFWVYIDEGDRVSFEDVIAGQFRGH